MSFVCIDCGHEVPDPPLEPCSACPEGSGSRWRNTEGQPPALPEWGGEEEPDA